MIKKFTKLEWILVEMDSSDGCTILWMYLMLLNHTLKYGKFYVYFTLVAQMVQNLPAVQMTQVWSLDQEDPQEKGMATHSSILAWRIPPARVPKSRAWLSD